MPSIALATCADEATLFHDEEILVSTLEAHNVTVFPVVWNSPEIDWQSYDVVVLRNTWDYHHQISAFRAWLDYLDSNAICVINSTDLVRWNLDKRYLAQLIEQGIQTLPTIFASGKTIKLRDIFDEHEWSEIVVKPIISGSGDNTWTITRETADYHQRQFDWLNEQIGMLIQPLAPQINTDGEYSLVFFAGDYSHAVLKKPPQDSIFVHEERGGSLQAYNADSGMINQAQQVIQATYKITGHMPSYARVDGLRDNDNFMLMELECVEPELYFKRSQEAAERFVTLILKALE